MNGKIVQLADGRGNRHESTDHETAYQAWRATGRSLRKLEQLTGISKSTLGNWSKDDGWIERAKREDQEDASIIRDTYVGILAAQIVDNLAAFIEIRDDKTAPHRDRHNAAAYLNGLAGISPAIKMQSTVTLVDHAEAHHEQQPELDGKSVNELMAIEARFRSKP